MKYYRLIDPLLGYMLAVEAEPGALSNLSSVEPGLQSLDELFKIASVARMEPDEVSDESSSLKISRPTSSMS